MDRLFVTLLLGPAFAAVLGFASPAHAAAQRTFVASYGLTANTAFNCSIAKPCRAFGEAIGVTNPKGEVVVLDSAGYGPVTITKSVSIIAPPGVYAGVSVFSGSGITVNGPGVYVTLRGLAINGQGGDSGIDIQDAGRVRIENCIVSGMLHMGIFHRATGQVTVSDTIVRDNADDGIRMVTGVGALTLERVTSEGNGNSGFYISPNVADGQLDATISDSLFARNGSNGIWADAGASAAVFVSIDRSTLAENGSRGVFASGSGSAFVQVTAQRSTVRRNSGDGMVAFGSLPAHILVNASDNVMHHNSTWGLVADGSGALVRASANNFDIMGCQNGGAILTYQNNTVVNVIPGCSGPVPLR